MNSLIYLKGEKIIRRIGKKRNLTVIKLKNRERTLFKLVV